MNKDNEVTIDSYIQSFPGDIQHILIRLREVIRHAAPNATETIKYKMPAFILNGNLIYFAAYKNHIGLYSISDTATVFKDELSKYKLGKGSVQFPINEPLPYELIRKIVEYRVVENMKK